MLSLDFRTRRNLVYGLFLLVPIILYVGAFIYPMIDTIWLSLHSWDGMSPERTFIGLDNFYKLLGQARTQRAFFNNLQWLVYFLLAPTLVGLGLALLLDEKLKGAYVFRTIFFLPFTITTVAVASAWRWLYRPSTGLFSALMNSMGLGDITPNWLGDPQIVTYSIMAASLWQWSGFTFLIYFAGLRGLPPEYIEAAKIDGASPWTILTKIKLPLLLPSTIVVLGIAGVDSMRVFDIVWSMTQGGPFESSYVLAVDMYSTSFARFQMGQGAAVAVCLLILSAIVVMPYIYYMSSRVEEIRD